ncbi:hypothetical protein J132_05262 [Termitomyces sp. J132]|nr:hypothetical protein J132_05262 [Termitomyces sp. J132]
MAPNHLIPTAPCNNPVGPATKLPRAPPTTHPSSGQDSPDNFALLQRSVKRDAQQVILAVLQLPLFAQAIIGFCRVTAGIPGTQADRAQYLGTMQLRFANQADFPCIAKQKGLFDSLTATLPVINRNAANNSTDVQSFLMFADTILKIKKNHRKVQHQWEAELKQRTQDQDINMLGPPPICSGKWRANTEPDGKPKPKKLKVLPAFSNLKPGSEAMLLLLGQVNTALETVQLADNDALLPCADLQKNIVRPFSSLPSNNFILSTSPFNPSDVKRTGDLLNDLQVLPEVFLPF